MLLLLIAGRRGAQAPGLGASVELVDPKTFRVCADPRNLPFSDEAGEGFENKLAELFARKLGEPASYTYYPQVIGFVRNTLNALRCDVIMGVAVGDDLVQTTNPYYRTTYALVFKPGSGFDGIESLEDPRLKGKHIGIVAGTPPATVLVQQGLMALAQALCADGRYAHRSAGADDGRRYRGRADRRRRAVGSDRRLLCAACHAAPRGRAPAEGAGAHGLPHRHGRASQRSGLEAPAQSA